MAAVDYVLGWLRVGPATAEQIHAKVGDLINLKTVTKTLRALQTRGLAQPDGDVRNDFRVWRIADDPQAWRSVKWMCGQPRLRVSELYARSEDRQESA